MNFLHNQIFLCVQFSLCEVKNWESVDYGEDQNDLFGNEWSVKRRLNRQNSRLDNGKATMEQ